MSLLRLSIFAVFMVAFTTLAQADQIFVEQATGSDVTESELTTATTLVATAVGEVSSNTVVNQPDTADLTLRPTLVRLGEAYILGLSKVKNGKIVFSSQLKAAFMHELDKVAERLTRSVLTGEKAKDNPRVGEITEQEAHDGAQRRPTRNETLLSFGGSEFSNLNSSGLGYSIGFGHAWDVNVALLKIIGEVNVNGDAWMVNAGLGGNYFFTTTDTSPYVTADFGAGAAKIDGGGELSGQTVGGFVVGVGAGIQFLRTTSVNLDLGFHTSFMLHSNDLGIPLAYSVRLGLYF